MWIHVKKQLLLIAVLEGLFLTVWEQTEWFYLLQRQQFSARRTPWLTSHACLHILKICSDLLCTHRYILCISHFLSCLGCKAFGITHPDSPLLNMLFKDLFLFFTDFFSLNWKRGIKIKAKTLWEAFMKCTFRSPAMLAQQLAHLNSRYVLHRVFLEMLAYRKSNAPFGS